MTVGTKSVLFGAHCFFLHPWFVALAWWKLYGFPFDPRLWIAFFVHDLGYIGKPNMDGDEGELHPYLGARIMLRLFGYRWYKFCLFHSRFLAKKKGEHFSRLCVADKLAFSLTPRWLYLPMVNWSGEIFEYMKLAEVNNTRADGKYSTQGINVENQKKWWDSVDNYMRKWVEEHKDLRPDTWTPDTREAKSKEGAWK